MRFSLSVSIGRRIASLIEVVVYHRHTACPGFATFGLVRLEIGWEGIYPYPLFTPRNFGFCAVNLAVYLRGCLSLHSVGDMAVYIDCCCRGNMSYRCGQRFYVHTIFKCHRRKCVSEVMKSYSWAARSFQYQLEAFAYCRGRSWACAINR